MNRIEINVQTGEVTTVMLTAEEIAEIQANHEKWLAEEAQRKQDRIELLKTELADLEQPA